METSEEKELRNKIEEILKRKGFRSIRLNGFLVLDVKYEGVIIENSSVVKLDSIYAHSTGFRADGAFKGIMLSSGYGKYKIVTKIMLSNSSTSVIIKRVEEFKEKYKTMTINRFVKEMKYKKEEEDSKSLKSLLTNPRFSYFSVEASKYKDEYTMKIHNIKLKEMKQIIELLNKMDKK